MRVAQQIKKLIKRFLCARTSIKTHVNIASTAEAGLQDCPLLFLCFTSFILTRTYGVLRPLFMDTPNLLVVPPTPLEAKLAPSPSPSISTIPSTPGLTQSSDDNQRDSSETTMEIYSMYGDDNPSSWPNHTPFQGISTAELGYRSVDHSSRESSTYYTATAKSRSSHGGAAFRVSANSTGSGSSTTDSSSPYIGIEEDLSAAPHTEFPPVPPPKPPQRHSGTSSPLRHFDGTIDVTSPQSRYLSPSPPHSRPSSSRSSPLNGHLPPAPRSPHGPPSEQGSVTSPSSRLISRPASQTTATSTSPRLLSKKRSSLSITPSAGEDPDSFLVRSTYAQLDILGVKGDGIEEGVERTRARVGGSRESELRAMNAVGDEDEKRRDLSPQELQMLSSLDR